MDIVFEIFHNFFLFLLIRDQISTICCHFARAFMSNMLDIEYYDNFSNLHIVVADNFAY